MRSVVTATSIALLLLSVNFSEAKPFSEGEALFFSSFTFKGYPQYTGNSIQEFAERPLYEKPRFITYNRYIKTTFADSKTRVDVNTLPDVNFPKPIGNSYVHDGNDLHFFDNVNRVALGVMNQNTPIRMTDMGINQIPAYCFGYDVEGIIELASLVKRYGETPSLRVEESPSFLIVWGEYPNGEELKLAEIVLGEQPGDPFQEATYFQPQYNAVVKIINRDVEEIDGVLFPKTVYVKVRQADSIAGFYAGGFVIDDMLTLVDAKFTSAEIDDEVFSTAVPEGYRDYANQDERRRQLRGRK